jgi:hypothetical protein
MKDTNQELYNIGQLVSSNSPEQGKKFDFGVVTRVTKTKKNQYRYYILWQKDKDTCGPYDTLDISVFVDFYKKWESQNVQNNKD